MRNKSDPKFVKAYDRAVLRSAFVSLFWGIISRRKEREGFTLQALAKKLGTNKAEVSRWFGGDPNWTLNTVAALANALGVDLVIRAVDHKTGEVFTPAGVQAETAAGGGTTLINVGVSTDATVRGGRAISREMNLTRVPADSKLQKSVFSSEVAA